MFTYRTIIAQVVVFSGICYYLINAIAYRKRRKGAREPPGPRGMTPFALNNIALQISRLDNACYAEWKNVN
jgi:hypothetical protein